MLSLKLHMAHELQCLSPNWPLDDMKQGIQEVEWVGLGLFAMGNYLCFFFPCLTFTGRTELP